MKGNTRFYTINQRSRPVPRFPFSVWYHHQRDTGAHHMNYSMEWVFFFFFFRGFCEQPECAEQIWQRRFLVSGHQPFSSGIVQQRVFLKDVKFALEKKQHLFWFLPKYTDVCQHCILSILSRFLWGTKNRGILLGWDSNPRPLQF